MVRVSEDYFELCVDERAVGGRSEQETSGNSGRTLKSQNQDPPS